VRSLRRPGAGLLITVLCLAACGPPRPAQRTGWAGAQDPALLLRADAEALQALTDLTAEVRFKLHEVGSASGSILFRPPALMRLDVRGPLFQHILSAVIDADTLTALANGQLYRMPSRDGLDAFLTIDLAGYDPRLVLLGIIAPALRRIESIDYPRADRAHLTLDDGIEGQRRRLWIDLHKGFVEREELVDDEGRRLWSRDLSRWRRLAEGDLYLPARIRIESHGRVLELNYGDVNLDRGLERATFFNGIADP